MDNTIANLGKRIKLIRIKKRLTQEGLAARSGLTKSYISLLEAGKKIPAISTLSRIAVAFGMRIGEFFEAYSRLTAYQLGGLFIKRIFGIARDLRVQHSLASGDSLRPDTSVGIDCERFMPESEMILQVDISRFARVINRLRDDMAEAFVLRVFAGFDASEIGLIMVKSDVAVKMLIYRTLCELNRLIYLRN